MNERKEPSAEALEALLALRGDSRPEPVGNNGKKGQIVIFEPQSGKKRPTSLLIHEDPLVLLIVEASPMRDSQNNENAMLYTVQGDKGGSVSFTTSEAGCVYPAQAWLNWSTLAKRSLAVDLSVAAGKASSRR